MTVYIISLFFVISAGAIIGRFLTTQNVTKIFLIFFTSLLVAGILNASSILNIHADWSYPYICAFGGTLIGAAFVFTKKSLESGGWLLSGVGAAVGLVLGTLFYKAVFLLLPPQWYAFLPGKAPVSDYLSIPYPIFAIAIGLAGIIFVVRKV